MIKAKARVKPLDIILGLALVAAGTYVAHRVIEDLHYKWDWVSMPQYLLRYDEEGGRWVPNMLLQGLLMTIRLSLWGTILATFLGTAMGLLRVSRRLFGRLVARTYVEVMRNSPPLVLIFLFYYFLSGQVMTALGIDTILTGMSEDTQSLVALLFAPPSRFSAFASALITLAILESAYITEIIRAGIQSIEKGIWEAGHALGLSRWQLMRRVILPLAAQRIIPPLAGQFISTIKDSAIVSAISIQELTFQGMELTAATYLTFEVWITVTVLYLVLTLSLSVALGRVEKYLRRSEA